METLRKSAAERRELVGRLIAEREATGETWRSVSARTGINYATLTAWVWRYRGERRAGELCSAGSGFIELVTTEPDSGSAEIEVVLRGDRRVRLTAGFDTALLTRLVRALESC